MKGSLMTGNGPFKRKFIFNVPFEQLLPLIMDAFGIFCFKTLWVFFDMCLFLLTLS